MSNGRDTREWRRRLRALGNVVLFATGFLVTTLAVTNVPGAETSEGITGLGVLVWLAAVLAWITVFFRRTYPVIVMGAGLMLAIIGTEYLLLLIGVHHAALAWTGRRRMWLSLGAVGVVALYWLRDALTPWGDRMVLSIDGDPSYTPLVSGVIAVTSLGVTGALTMLMSTRRLADGQRARAEAAHSHADQLGAELARQEERSQIAREIHDGLTNRLALVSMMGGNVERAVRHGDPEAAALASDLKSEARHALTDLRALVGDLRTEPTAPPSRETSMRSLADLISASRAAGTKVDAIVILDGASEAPPDLDAAVFRMVQEALTNAVKHAPHQTVSLYLNADPSNGVRLRVANALEGAGSSAARGNADVGSGLDGMRERVAALQGTSWTGEHDGEFIVDVTVPWMMSEAVSPGSHHAVAPANGQGQ